MDRDYRFTARAHGVPIDRCKGDDLAIFHIERARFHSSWYMIAIAVTTIAGYGWSIAARVVRSPCTPLASYKLIMAKQVAVPLILQFFIGGSITVLFNMCGTLLTDINHQHPATAQASSNIVRCALSAAGLAVLQVLIDHIGVGWTFTVFAVLCLRTTLIIRILVRWGLQWRLAREPIAASFVSHLIMVLELRLLSDCMETCRFLVKTAFSNNHDRTFVIRNWLML